MKTVTLYAISELNGKAKEKAIAEFSEVYEFGWSYEAFNSIKSLADEFGVETINYSIDWSNGSPSFITFTDTEMGINEVIKVVKELELAKDKCPLTGVCYDYDVINGFLERLVDNVKDYNDDDISELVNKSLHDAFRRLLRATESEIEHNTTDESYIDDYCESNEIWFTERGNLIHI